MSVCHGLNVSQVWLLWHSFYTWFSSHHPQGLGSMLLYLPHTATADSRRMPTRRALLEDQCWRCSLHRPGTYQSSYPTGSCRSPTKALPWTYWLLGPEMLELKRVKPQGAYVITSGARIIVCLQVHTWTHYCDEIIWTLNIFSFGNLFFFLRLFIVSRELRLKR